MKQLIFINSHPIQYFAPMYKYLNNEGIKVQAWYCTDSSIKGGYDKEFGTEVKWDIPLLQGYEHHFFKNYGSYEKGKRGFFSLMNFGLIKNLFKTQKSVIVVHGWHYLTHFLVIMLGKMAGHTICLRNDVPQSHEALKVGWKQKVKKLGLKLFLFPRVNYFLYIGTQNKLFYKSYDLADNRLLFCPYAVDNDRFKLEKDMLADKISAIKGSFGIADEDKVIVFSAKYISKKRPLDLLQAFNNLQADNCWLIFVGEGELRGEMEKYIQDHDLKRVILTGFVNQSQITSYYAIANVFVMCSSFGENWGLSVNEAMNFDLPLVVSDLTGCADDLVLEGVNGYIIKTGDVAQLTDRIRKVLYQKSLTWQRSSENIVADYSYGAVAKNIVTIL
ncbi:glycosyltransferase family 4 protein [Mucilaginibacter galii]|nr:glycosyltransferase family 4 protein [Mucilaginibacter galii]